ncbi:MAG: hypothetical protein LBV80_07890 [Deltaproteobacteria bacterium]|jgi:hypothetical protein|nr:hypothetical protein [Deltaproteobacteria bacterium]
MSGFYGKTRKTASGLLGKFGVKVTVRREIKGAYNPATGRNEPGQITEWTPYAVKTGIKEEYFTAGSMGGTRINVGDMQLLIGCEGQPEIPKVGDSVIFPGGEKWKIVQSAPVDPGDVVVLYKGVIRKG